MERSKRMKKVGKLQGFLLAIALFLSLEVNVLAASTPISGAEGTDLNYNLAMNTSSAKASPVVETTKTVSTLLSALAADRDGAVKKIVINAPLTLTSNWTPTKALRIDDGGSITLAGFNLDLTNVPFEGSYGCFVQNGTGKVMGLKQTDPVWWGADKTGSKNSTEAFSAATLCAANAGGTLEIPNGTFLIDGNSWRVKKNNLQIRGAGKTQTTVKWASGTALEVNGRLDGGTGAAPGQIIIEGIEFNGQGTDKKTALKMVDATYCAVRDTLYCGLSQRGSIAIYTQGRDQFEIYHTQIYDTDRPLVIGKNPYATGAEDFDLCHIEDFTATCTNDTGKVIFVESGVILSSLVLDGYINLGGGAYGIFWADTAGRAASYQVKISNLRRENPGVTTGWDIYLKSNYSLQNLIIENVKTSSQANGIYLAKVQSAFISNTDISSEAGKTALYSTAEAGYKLTVNNVTCDPRAIVDLVSYRELFAFDTNHPLPRNAYYAFVDTNSDTMMTRVNGVKSLSLQGTLPAGRSAPLAVENVGTRSCTITVSASYPSVSEGGIALFSNEGSQSWVKMAGTSNFSADGIDHAGKLCLHVDGVTGRLSLSNNLVSDVHYIVTMTWQ